MNRGSDPYKINHFLKECSENFHMQYVNCFNRLLKSAKNCKKCTFLDNLIAITQEENTKTRKMTLLFSSTFSSLTDCNNQFFESENSQNWFWCGPLLVHSGLKNTSILSKSYRFGQPIILLQKLSSLKLVKIHVMFCPQRYAKKPFW